MQWNHEALKDTTEQKGLLDLQEALDLARKREEESRKEGGSASQSTGSNVGKSSAVLSQEIVEYKAKMKQRRKEE